jgi:hypothetical protein
MPPAGEIRVEGLRELSRAFAKASPQARKELRKVLKEVAVPVQHRAERLAAVEIRNLDAGDPWDKARIGVTQKEVYVVPKQKGVRGRGSKRRRRFGEQLMELAYQPALEQNRTMIVREFDAMLDRVAERINAA